VELASATPGASIRYTTNGSTPSESDGIAYSAPIAISATATLKAIAYKAGMIDSPIAAAVYTIHPIVVPGTVASPTFSPPGGTYPQAQTVFLATATSGASIRYTLDGSDPNANNGAVYSAPIAISATATLKAVATKAGLADSDVVSATYTIVTPPPPPVSPYVLYEKFDAMTTGAAPAAPWQSDVSGGGAVTIREVPFAADKSVELTKPAGPGLASLSAALASQVGRVAIEAKVLARETAGFKGIPYVYDDAGTAIASVSFQDGNIQARVGGTATTLQPFTANTWYLVRIVIDTRRGVFDLYVDGVRKLRDQALRAPAALVARVRYYTDAASAATLLVDSVRIYDEASYIGAPPAPVFDVRDYGAAGDGTTNDQAAIQRAIAAAAGTGGSVLLTGGTFLSGTLTLGSHMTFFIDASAVLLGSTNPADYPSQAPNTGNTQLGNCRRALLYAPEVTDLKIDGGGSMNGQGDAFPGAGGTEPLRPMLIWSVLSDRVTVRNLYLEKGAMWSLVTMETDDVLIDNVGVQSDGITHDGIDVVDGKNVVVQNAAVRSGDDAMVLKSGVRRGIDTLTIRDSFFGGSGTSGGSNGIKFGTATYGGFKDIAIHDAYVKDVKFAAMAVESRQGSDISGVAFDRIAFSDVGAAFFVYLAQQSTVHPAGDDPKLGSIDGVSFTDISGSTASWPESPHQGSLITGHVFDGVTYPIKNLAFTNVAVDFTGGFTGTPPGAPPEATPNQYPESRMFGDLPAWGYYLRHVDGVTFTNCTSTVSSADSRPGFVINDVTGLAGTP
jgi:polygalacturonase